MLCRRYSQPCMQTQLRAPRRGNSLSSEFREAGTAMFLAALANDEDVSACVPCVQIVHPLLESGVLPLSSLRLVGGYCLGKVCRARSDGAWWSNVERVAVAVLQGSLGYEELHEAWVAAGLTVHTCQVRRPML